LRFRAKTGNARFTAHAIWTLDQEPKGGGLSRSDIVVLQPQRPPRHF
jgi:hypothetical protein